VKIRAAVITAALFVAALPVRAHIVYGATTLRQLTFQSDLVARARIVDPSAELALEEELEHETVVVADVLEVFKGPREERVRFVQHGHGVPLYRPGDEVVVFLQRTERSRELVGSGVAKRVGFVSIQEAGERFALDAASRDAFTGALRGYAAIEGLPADARPDALRRITVELLASQNAELASSALSDLALAGDRPLVTRGDLPVLEPLLESSATPIGVRVGLLAELDRRGFVDGPPRWAALLRTTSGADRLAAVRAAGAHPSEAVEKELKALLASSDPLLVAAAAVAIGTPGAENAVTSLAKLLDSREPRVRSAAIRGLGRIATKSARQVLAKAAASHSDADTRRRASAEVRLLSQ
jgi:HEAT repeats